MLALQCAQNIKAASMKALQDRPSGGLEFFPRGAFLWRTQSPYIAAKPLSEKILP